ncbi:MAG: S8 family serine peptidase [bacterium]
MFSPGWNLISIPSHPGDDDLCRAFPPAVSLFDYDGGAYRTCARAGVPFVHGKAYWAYFPEETRISIAGESPASPTTHVVLKKGWNLLGNTSGKMLPWDASVLVDGVPITESAAPPSPPFEYDPAAGRYRRAGLLKPWQGYALYVPADCTLTLPGEPGAQDAIIYAAFGDDRISSLPDGTRHVARELLIQAEGGADETLVVEKVGALGGRVTGVNPFVKLYQVEFPDGTDVAAAADSLSAAPGIRAAVVNVVLVLPDYVPDDPPYSAEAPQEQRWAWDRIGAPRVWTPDAAAGSPLIAVVDTGVDGTHPDLAGRAVPGKSFVAPGEPGNADANGHGTHVAGIIAAAAGNGAGIAGVCRDCRILPLKVCAVSGDCPFFTVLNGIVHAANEGARVINVSLAAADAPPQATAVFQSVVDYAAGKGALVVAAAGNAAGDAADTIPAALDNLLAVGATDRTDRRAPFSNSGAVVDLAAPGVSIYSLEPGGGAAFRQGTSTSAGFVSGAAGHLLAVQPALTAPELRGILLDTAVALPGEDLLGAGRLNLYAAHLRLNPENQPPRILDLKVSASVVNPGESVQASFGMYDPDGDVMSYRWEIEAGTLSTPPGSVVTWTLPHEPGTYRIAVHVTDGRGGAVSESVSVQAGAARLRHIRVYPSVVQLRQGEETTLKAYGFFEDGRLIPVHAAWSMDNPVGVIDENGKLTPTAEGSAVVTASVGEITGRCLVFVDVNASFPSLVPAGFADSGQNLGGASDEVVEIGDLDGDGDGDLVIGQVDDVNQVYLNNGAGTFALAGNTATSLTTTYFDLGDVDRDGDLDLVEAAANGQGWRVYFNNGAGGLTDSGQILGAGSDAYSARLADVDSDGDLDLLGADHINGQSNKLFLNNGFGTFGAPQNVGSSLPTLRVVPGDVDNDGDVDFVEANDLANADRVYINDGAGNFSPGQILPGVTSTAHLLLADVNGDGNLDIVSADQTNSEIDVLTGDGTGVFAWLTSFDTNDNFFLDAGDFENDGDLDVVTAPDWTNQLVYNNNGLGAFVNSGGSFAIGSRYVRAGDLDGDGDLDFANGSTTGGGDVFLNDAGPQNAPAAPATLSSFTDGNQVTLTWTDGSDTETADSDLLTYDVRVGAVSGGNDVFSGAVKAGAGNAGHPETSGILTHILKNLSNGTYYWSVRTVDSQLARSAWSVEKTFTINTLSPSGICTVATNADAGAGSLRQCITDTNASAGADTIEFDPAFGWDANPIALASALPALSDASGGTTIDNSTAKEVTVDGGGAFFDCFTVQTATNTIQGLSIVKCSGNNNSAIRITGAGAFNNTVAGNKIGTNNAGAALNGNDYGVTIANGANGNYIDGTTAAGKNVVSGNNKSGVYITGAGADSNVIKGNYIGTNPAGAAALGNTEHGVFIDQGAKYNTIGGAGATDGNVISGNAARGIRFSLAGTEWNTAIGNYIGTNAAGTAAIANNIGIELSWGTQNNTIGGDTAQERNVISGNTSQGIWVLANSGDVVTGNYVGVDKNGAALGNGGQGISVTNGATNNRIGGSVAGEDNLIAWNSGSGVNIEDAGTSLNEVTGNTIRDNGKIAAGNGVTITDSASGNFVRGNVIQSNGVALSGYGLYLANGANGNVIGGAGAGDPNVITTNNLAGIYLVTDTTDFNTFSRNRVYSNSGLGIDFDAGSPGANQGIAPPTVYCSTSLGGGLYNVTATSSCGAGCTVEFFQVDDPPGGVTEDPSLSGEGYYYLGSATTDATGTAAATLTIPAVGAGTKITATITDATGNTSEFALNYDITSPTACPSTSDPPVVTNVVFTPNSLPPDGATTTTVTADVSDPNGLADVASVTIDLTPVGGGAAVTLYDNGTNGDAVAGDGTYTLAGITVAIGTSAGAKTITVTATDLASNTGSGNGTLTVTNEPPVVTNVVFTPNSLPPDGATTTTVTADVSDPNGLADVASVTIDLTPIGGGAAVTLYDDGTNGDAVAGDGTYTLAGITVAIGTSAGAKTITVTATDSASNTGSGNGTLTVTNEPPVVTNVVFTPNSLPPDGATTTTVTADVSDPNGLADIASVTIDLTPIGGGATATLYDDGTNGDAFAGDGTYTLAGITVAIGTSAGAKTITVTATDLASNTGSGNGTLTVTNEPPVVTNVVFTPNSLPPDGATTTTVTADVSDPNGLADVASVTIDLTPIGGGAAVTLYDDGTNGDAAAGDGTYTLAGITVAIGTSAGAKTITVTATDSASNTGSGNGTLTVNGPPVVTSVTFDPNPVVKDGTTTATALVTDPDGIGDVVSVTIDLTPVGGAPGAAMSYTGGNSYELAFPLTGVAPGTYILWVTAEDTFAQTGAASGTLVIVDLMPRPPVMNSVVNNLGVIDVTWTSPTQDVTGAPLSQLDGHYLYRRESSTSTYTLVYTDATTSTGTVIAWTDAGVELFKTYCYVATAYITGIAESDYSNEKCALARPKEYNLVLQCGIDYITGEYYPPETPGRLNRPADVAADGAGFIYIADQDNHRIQKWNEDCGYVTHWGRLGPEDGNFRQPLGITYYGGNLYVVDNYNRVQAFDTNGAFLDSWTVMAPVGIEADPATGNLLVSAADNKIYVFQPDGTLLATWSASNPKQIAFDAAGNVYYVSMTGNKVVILDGSGNPAGGWGALGGDYGEFYYPFGIAIDGADTVYVSDTKNNRVEIFDTGGTMKNLIPYKHVDYALLNYPMGIGISSFSGRVFLCDANNSRLLVFSPP